MRVTLKGNIKSSIEMAKHQTKQRPIHSFASRGRTAVAQARLILIVMVNVAQLWILAATVEAALAHRFSALLPLVIASGICFVVTLTLIFWWRPASRRFTSSGYLKR
jgi:hypothetical protein